MRSILFCSNKKDKTLQKVSNKASSVVNHSCHMEDLEKPGKAPKGKKKKELEKTPARRSYSNSGNKCCRWEQPRRMKKGFLRPQGEQRGWYDEERMCWRSLASPPSSSTGHRVSLGRSEAFLHFVFMGWDGASMCLDRSLPCPPPGYDVVSLANTVQGLSNHFQAISLHKAGSQPAEPT